VPITFQQGPLENRLWLFEPGTAVQHNLTAQAFLACGNRETPAEGQLTVDSLTVDVVGVK
jgi:hypothetical protein